MANPVTQTPLHFFPETVSEARSAFNCLDARSVLAQNALLPMSRRLRLRYDVASLSVMLALLLTLPFWSFPHAFDLPLFWAAVGASTGYGGLGPGLWATICATAVIADFLLPPFGALAVGHPLDRALLVVFACVAVLLVLRIARHKRAKG